ncbi:hydroxyacylglutathione hydrolase [Microbulbifer agarilyticus]|uniref:hydroxyacylglutathione hydrolase n=1 Tax=Microbulbifer agarilyticus TaxID=260552 RepID=UPI001C967E7F|nr:hydroxyacylglutathione hydrolase [Microbulbifer agarilyticus]MBY6189096.1 hydroxyacylglutathione hydrolase [Microbulbifer agarilyticus]
MITIRPIPAFNDNYIWHLQQNDEHWVVDPGDAAPVMAALAGKQLHGILLTHHHFDHTGGVAELTAAFNCPVYGPATIEGVTHPLRDGDHLTLLGAPCEVLAVPGHTLDHIALLMTDGEAKHLFCGDTLFAGGCGRLFEGTPNQMYQSLSRLAALPGDTRVYCAHEYTLANLEFALAVDANNPRLRDRQRDAKAIRDRGEPTLPSSIELERATNPFLRADEPDIRLQAQAKGLPENANPVEIFANLRHQKDVF